MTPIWGLYHRSRPEQIEALQSIYPIAYLPWGALEYHSYHNPVGLDGTKAFHLCCDLAQVCGGLVFPCVYQAANLIKSYPGVDFKMHNLEFSEELIRLTCTEYFQQLVENKFKVIVCLSGHAGQPHLNILKSVSDQFAQKYEDVRFWTLAEFEILPDDLLVANHSAKGETSLQLYYAKETVKVENLPIDRAITLVEDGVSGEDPRLSSPNYGEIIANNFVQTASKIIHHFLKEVTNKNNKNEL